jgi:VIT1/CCC1 family predicted Fe2+/Mn2+ transporter
MSLVPKETPDIDKETMKSILALQGNEITEHAIYRRLASSTIDQNNHKVLERIARDEVDHYAYWRSISGRDVNPDRLRVFWYVSISRILGLSFGLKMMERGEELAQEVYGQLKSQYADIESLILDEQKHEEEILDMLEEERIEYASSVVLGLNDALVELTGALAGLTLALRNGRIIAVIGLITGIAASMSMAASGYLSSREESTDREKNSLKAATYTGAAYVLTVLLLILPYLLLDNVFTAMAAMIATGILIISAYTFYITTAKKLSFWGRFLEMSFISLGVATISFWVGWAIRHLFGVEI